MIKRNVLGLIFANAYDETVPELTADRPMASIPVLGRYRMIDFNLSSMRNAGIDQVGVITKANYHSLMRHLGTGRPWDLSRKNQGLTIIPPYAYNNGAFTGRIEALYNSLTYLKESTADYVVLADCNRIHNIDLSAALSSHISHKADLTLICGKGSLSDKTETAIMSVETDSYNRVASVSYVTEVGESRLLSMNVFIVLREKLIAMVEEAGNSSESSFELMLMNKLKEIQTNVYVHEGYMDIISGFKSYYSAQMKLIDPENMAKLFCNENPIHTKVRDEAPVKYAHGCKAVNSLVADGCVIEGEIDNCILFRGVHVPAGCRIKDCIIFRGTTLEKNTSLKSVVADRFTLISEGVRIEASPDAPLYIPKNSLIK